MARPLPPAPLQRVRDPEPAEVWSVDIASEFLPGPMRAVAIAAHPAAFPLVDYFVVVDDGNLQGDGAPPIARVALDGKLTPEADSARQLPRRTWQLIVHALEQARDRKPGGRR